ncbi:mandelate racemase/muconate lactonizing enzyme family protein [Bordetella muralis]
MESALKITRIIEAPIALRSNISNAYVNFSQHTVSLLAVVTDKTLNGKPLIGLSFNSIGRYAQSDIINTRMAPRLLQAAPDDLLTECGSRISPEKVLACSLKNEKPGGHGDRAMAASALEMAIWDLNAKLNDEPVSATIARQFGRPGRDDQVAVYAAGGYYYDGEATTKLIDELKHYQQMGFTRYKIKIGGADLASDLQRIDAALTVAGAASNLAVDANGRFDLQTALEYGRALEPYGLMWFEEAGDPLDLELNAALSEAYSGALATGENLFSHQDVKNLALFGGCRPGIDVFQMDPGLSYGMTEYHRMLGVLEGRGFNRRQCYPHSGQLLGLHAVSGFGLGGSEAYPGIFQPLGGFCDDSRFTDGFVRVPDHPGFGFEYKNALLQAFQRLLA